MLLLIMYLRTSLGSETLLCLDSTFQSLPIFQYVITCHTSRLFPKNVYTNSVWLMMEQSARFVLLKSKCMCISEFILWLIINPRGLVVSDSRNMCLNNHQGINVLVLSVTFNNHLYCMYLALSYRTPSNPIFTSLKKKQSFQLRRDVLEF